MYVPRSWPILASEINSAIEGDGAPILNVVQATVELNSTRSPETAYANPAVICSDTKPFPDDVDPEKIFEQSIDAIVKVTQISKYFGGTWGLEECHYWRLKPADRFEGPWNHTLSNTVLIIGNTVSAIIFSSELADHCYFTFRLMYVILKARCGRRFNSESFSLSRHYEMQKYIMSS